ncbi:restriction endonuclease subunit S [Dehalobacter restrictus]|uniref:restriction endonuclease subunit S n=1 Tax=Dehalobacter restrictus TaxID=55583 RepID=UPI00339003BA
MPIGTLFSIIGGGTPTTSLSEYWGDGIPWFSSADIDEGGNITPRRCVTPTGIEHSTTNVVPSGSVVVVTRVGLGKVAILNTVMCFSQDNQALIPIYPEVINSRFLFYFLLHEMQTLKLSGRGTTISGITKKQLADVNLWLPPIAEQSRIVAVLEATYAQFDEIAENLS